MYNAKLNSLLRRIEKYTHSPFSGKKGSRRRLIERDLTWNGLSPFIDSSGNLWAKKGNGEKIVLLSSHMDTVFGCNPHKQKFKMKHGKIRGTLDNSVGCAINVEIAKRIQSKHTLYFVFTVEEESGNSGAKGAVESLEKGLFGDKNIKPDLCIVLDVTEGKWKNRNAKDLAVVENFSTNKLKGYVEDVVKKWKFDKIGVEYQGDGDETFIYGNKHNSFALGPMVFDGYHTSKCYTYLRNLDATLTVLGKMLTDDEFLKGLPEFYEMGHSTGPTIVWKSTPGHTTGPSPFMGMGVRGIGSGVHPGIDNGLRPVNAGYTGKKVGSNSTRKDMDEAVVYALLDELIVQSGQAMAYIYNGDYASAYKTLLDIGGVVQQAKDEISIIGDAEYEG